MTSLRKFSIVLLVVAALAGLLAAPAQAQLSPNCNSNSFPSQMTLGSSYALTCSAVGGTTPYSFSYSGTLPSGMQPYTFGSEYAIEGQASLAGSYSFTVTVRDANSNTASQSFSVSVSTGGSASGTITLTSVSPNTLSAGIAYSLYLYGTNFSGNSIAHFNGTTVQTSYVNSTNIIASVPSYLVTSGSLPVYVTDSSTGTSGTLYVTVSGSSGNGTLSLTSMSPTSVATGSGAFTLTLYGSGFSVGALLNFGSICTVNTSFSSSSQISATIPASCLTTAQTVNVSVGGSNALQFVIGGTGSSGTITVTSVSPTTLTAGVGTTMYVYGSNFTPNSLVYFNGSQVSTSYQNSSTYLTATIPSYLVTSGSLPLYVRDSSTGTSNTVYVSVGGSGSTGIISLTSVSPNTLAPGNAVTLYAYGNNFTGSSTVHFNGSAVSTSYQGSSTYLIANVPAYLVTSGSLPVYVSDPVNGTSGTIYVSVSGSGSGSGGLSLTSMSPTSIGTGSAAFTLTLFGSGFISGNLVNFGTACTVGTQFVSSSQLTATIPASCLTTAQTVNVTVGSSNALQFVIGGTGSSGTVTLTSVSPTTLSPGVGSTLYLYGSNFTANSLVYFNGSQVSTSYQNSSTYLVATIPSYLVTSGSLPVYVRDSSTGTSGTVYVTVSGSGSTGTITLSSVSPTTLTPGTATTLYVYGTNFTGSSTVHFNGSALQTTYQGSSAYLIASVPANLVTSGSLPVYVSDPTNGTSSTLYVTVSGSGTGSGSLTMTCSPGVGPQSLSIVFYTTCTASGGIQQYVWSTSGLPAYLTLSSTTGSSITITGTPSSTGPYNFTVKVTDSSSPAQVANLQLAGQVNGANSGTGGVILTSLSPVSVAVNSPTFALTVNGSGFSSGSGVVFDGFPVVTQFISGNQLVATIPGGYLNYARAAQVTVSTPGVGTSNALSFLIGTGVTGTVSISCSPGVGPSAPNTYYAGTCSANGGTGPYTWTVNGGSLPSGLTLSPNGVTAGISGYTTLNGPYSYTLQVTDSSNPVNTATAVFAGTTGAGSGTVGGLSLSSLSPNSAAVGSQATTITINGTGFTSASTASFNGTALSTTFVNAGQLSAVIPASLLTQAMTATVTVNASGVTSNGLSFTVGTVAVTGITVNCSPTAGPPSPGYNYSSTCTATGGKAPYAWSITNGQLPSGLVLSNSVTSTVMISGLTFLNGSYTYTLQVTDSSTPAQTASYPFAGSLGATTGSGFAGTITSLNPPSAPVVGGQFTLTVTGSGFVNGASVVYWGGTPLATTYLSASQVYAIVPSNLLTTIGTDFITVQTSGYGSTNQVGFFVSGAGAVTVAPASLSFTYALGGSFPAAQTLNVTSNVGITGFSVTVNGVSNNVSWLTASPTSSGIPGTVSVIVSPYNLPVGTYTGTVTITGYSVGTGVVVPVSLTVLGPPTLVPSSTSLNFTSSAGATAPTQIVKITASDGNTVIPYNVTSISNNGGSWLSVTPTSGSTPGSFTVTANAANLVNATYSGSITVTPSGGLGSVISIPVTLTVAPPFTISASPTSLTFSGVTGQSNPASQTIAVSASGGTAAAYSVAVSTTSGGTWLSATASGTTPGSISVSANIANLAVGNYTGSVTITAGATNSPLTVPVTLAVSNVGALTSSPSSVTYNYQIGNGGPNPVTLNLTGPNGSGNYNFTVSVSTTSGGNWLSTSPTSGTTPSSIAVTANASGLQAGVYNANITITAPGAGTLVVPVTLNVAPPTFTLSVSPQTLTFNAGSSGPAPATQTVSVSTTNNSAVNYNVTAASTGNWLSATLTGTTPGTITVSVNPAGLATGQYTGTLSIASTGATNTPQTVQVTLNVGTAATIIALPQNLSFSVPGDGSTPAPQTLSVISTGANTSFTASATSQGGNWLSVSGSGQTPGSVTVSVNPSGLAAGQSYNGTVTISAPAFNPGTIQVPVSITLAAQGAAPLQAAPKTLYLSYQQGAGSDLQHIVVLNNGGGTVNYSVQGGGSGPGAQACGNWLNVITTSGSATATTPGLVAFNVNPSGLKSQTCTGVVIITETNGRQTAVPVYLAIGGGTQSVLLSQTAMNFVAAANGSAAAQTFEILNPGSGTMQWSISSSTLSGGSWLSVNPNSGSSQSLSQPGSPISVSVNPQGLAAGTYYGTVQVTSSGVFNSPQSITVTLTVQGSGTNPTPLIDPAGVVLTGTNGTSDTQTVNITNPGSGVVSYSAILMTDDGQNWLAASPTNGSIAAGATNAISLSANVSGLGTGLRHGVLRIVFSNGTVQTVDVQLAVAGTSSGTGVHSCGASDLAMEFLSPAQNFQASARVGVPLKVLVKDCSGNLLTSSNTGVDVLVGTSGTDVHLNYTGNGIWTGTWTPAGASPVVSLNALAVEITGGGAASGSVTANGLAAAALPNAPPYVAAVVNAGSFVLPGLVAPGEMVSIFGSGLADGQMQVYSVPYPYTLQGAQFTVHNMPLPLFYGSDGQVNAILPIGVTANERDQLIVVRDTTQSAPVDLLVADTAPGAFAVNSQGTGQGAILVGGTAQIAAPVGSIPGAQTGPATAGQTVSIFLSGLGVVTNPPTDGSASTGSSLTTVTPVVNIGGVTATVTYSGLAPGEVGLYQVNAVVPSGTQTGDAVPVFITIGNQTANTVTMAVR